MQLKLIISSIFLTHAILTFAVGDVKKHLDIHEAQVIIDREKTTVKDSLERDALDEIRKLAMNYQEVADHVGYKIANGGGSGVGGSSMLGVAVHYAAVDCKWNVRQLRKRYPALEGV